MKKSLIISIIVVIFIIIIGFILGTKSYFLIKYNSLMKNENYVQILNNLSNINYINVNKSNETISDYFISGNLKIRNDFKDFVKQDNSIFYVLDGTKKIAIGISEDTTILDLLKEDFDVYGVSFDNISSNKSIINYLKKNNINNDIELLQYFANRKKLSIFNSINEIKNTYSLYLYGTLILPSTKSITLINGDYVGFIYNLNDISKEVNLYKNNKRYIFTFINTEYFTDDYIKELISTVEIG